MLLVERFWASVTCVFSFLTLSNVEDGEVRNQQPLGLPADSVHNDLARGPVFHPPGVPRDSDFQCDYSAMVGWESCSTPEDRSCWLRNPKTGQVFNISTDYEDPVNLPVGINRTYYLNLTENSRKDLDGLVFPEGKYFNNSYPGPWIEACWGDNVTIIVTNHLSANGTSIHWHGIRQLNTTHMDGVNGVTQCPIAPRSSFAYRWTARQYGSTWYHSHYSVQYADGVAGPLTLHGPTSAPFDEPKKPIIMTDWGHNSAFNAQKGGLQNPSILLNGIGNITRYNNAIKSNTVPEPYSLTFEPPAPRKVKRYLLRLINTSFDATFVFSIDNHWMKVVSSDFVAITPYETTNILVGIGQRYNVIVNSTVYNNEDGSAPPRDGNFWIRTYKADCFRFTQGQASPGYERSGILRYNSRSKAIPTTKPWTADLSCSDEPFSKLKPIVPWQVGNAANDPLGKVGENITVQLVFGPSAPFHFPWAFASMGGEDYNPMLIDYGDPTFLHLQYAGKWSSLWNVFPEEHEQHEWVFLILRGLQGRTTGAHPIHLHGHDFAILAQRNDSHFPTDPKDLTLKLDNPPRRDVVLLPTDGYAVIAFRADNPGPWLAHCHIASHAGGGLALQIMERQRDALAIWPNHERSQAIQMVQNGCNEWNKFWGDCSNWWVPPGKPRGWACQFGNEGFSPDSGI